MLTRRFKEAAHIYTAALVSTAFAFGPAQAQWIPARGEGALTIEYQRFGTSTDIWSDIGRVRWEVGEADEQIVEGNILVASVDYGIYDRLGLNVTLPFINSEFKRGDFIYTDRVTADNAPNNALQDLGVSLSHLALTDPLMVTTSIGVTWPLSDYKTHGHASIGRNLKTFSAGVGMARRLNPILTDFLLQVSYAYIYSEAVGGFRPNRGNLSASLTYFPPLASVSLSAYWNQQFAHGGLGWSDPEWETNVREYWPIHDRVAREEFAQVGGLVAYAVNQRLNLYLSAFTTIEELSQNTQRVETVSFGTTTNF